MQPTGTKKQKTKQNPQTAIGIEFFKKKKNITGHNYCCLISPKVFKDSLEFWQEGEVFELQLCISVLLP